MIIKPRQRKDTYIDDKSLVAGGAGDVGGDDKEIDVLDITGCELLGVTPLQLLSSLSESPVHCESFSPTFTSYVVEKKK